MRRSSSCDQLKPTGEALPTDLSDRKRTRGHKTVVAKVLVKAERASSLQPDHPGWAPFSTAAARLQPVASTSKPAVSRRQDVKHLMSSSGLEPASDHSHDAPEQHRLSTESTRTSGDSKDSDTLMLDSSTVSRPGLMSVATPDSTSSGAFHSLQRSFSGLAQAPAHRHPIHLETVAESSSPCKSFSDASDCAASDSFAAHPHHDRMQSSPAAATHGSASPFALASHKGQRMSSCSLPDQAWGSSDALHQAADSIMPAAVCRARSDSLLWPLAGIDDTMEDPSASDGATDDDGKPRRGSFSGPMSDGHAAVQLFFRLNHARQTVDYVHRQVSAYSQLTHGRWPVWDALKLLDTLREYETPLLQSASAAPIPDSPDRTISLLDHALCSAEACREAYPDHDWLHLAGLLHSLGKLLAHRSFGEEPQWAICGESFPVGCKFSPAIVCSAFFSANPDRRRRRFNTPTGMYWQGCGLSQVHMSWSAAEYLHLVLKLNGTRLPPAALFLIRYHKFASVVKGSYAALLSEADRSMLPLLSHFQQLTAFRKPPASSLQLRSMSVLQHYSRLVEKYIPECSLQF